MDCLHGTEEERMFGSEKAVWKHDLPDKLVSESNILNSSTSFLVILG